DRHARVAIGLEVAAVRLDHRFELVLDDVAIEVEVHDAFRQWTRWVPERTTLPSARCSAPDTRAGRARRRRAAGVCGRIALLDRDAGILGRGGLARGEQQCA